MTSQRRLGLIFVLVGPPGAGKNVLMNNVLKRLPDLKQLPTATTRPMRPTEQQGREHLFVSHDEFHQMEADNALIESQVIHGEYYGMPKSTVQKAVEERQDIIADIDVLGATYLRSIYPDNAILIFIQPPSIDDLKSRMEARGETETEIEKRMRRVNMEMQYAPICDYLIINETGKLDQSSDTLYGIVLAERSRRNLLNLRVERQLPRQNFTYVASVTPLFQDQVLRNTDEPHLPTVQLMHGEYPHEAAMRALSEQFSIQTDTKQIYRSNEHNSPLSADLVLPIAVSSRQQVNHQEIVFHYIYLLSTQIQAPQNWTYSTYMSVDLPEAVNKAIEAVVFEPKEVLS